MKKILNAFAASALILTLASCTSPEEVPFEVTNHYYVSNAIDSIEQKLFDNEKDFTETFGLAAVMEEGAPKTDIDFKKKFVVAVVLPETDKPTELTPLKLEKKGDKLTLTYEALRRESQSYTSRPCLLLTVDRQWMAKDVEVKEISKGS
jgi:hypothetical protein